MNSIRIVCAILLAGLSALAQTPTTFTYQGTLTRFNVPVNGVYDFQFVLQSSGGVVYGTNVGFSITVSNGLFATTLDFGVSAFSGEARYLQIGVRTNGSSAVFSIMSPPQPVNPNPYAVRSISATSADKLQGYDWSALFGTNDPATGSLLDSKIRDGSISAGKLGMGTITSNQIAPQAITEAQIANSTITSNQIANATITSNQLAPNCIALTNLAERSITANKILLNSLTSNEISPGSISYDRLAARPVSTNVGIGGIAISSTLSL